MDTNQYLQIISQSISDIKGRDPVTINVEEKSSYADFIVVCHGTSTAHVKGISDKVEMAMKKVNVLPIGIEGYNESEWVLMDYNTVIVHIFLESVRNAYQLESLYQTPRETNPE